MMTEIYRVMKPDRYIVINIGKSDSYNIPDDFNSIVKDIGYKFIQTRHILFKQHGFVKSERDKRSEPLIILKKE
jgi:hypothetical protein